MQTTMKTIRRAAVAVTALAALLGTSSLVEAANYSAMGCSQLWYARNSIYAQNGYCFKTARARSVFGPGCFPPFGKLSGYEQQEISSIQYWEGRKGCSG